MSPADTTNRHRPLGSLVASAQQLTARKLKQTRGKIQATTWQEDAWNGYDLVGEHRFLATTLAGRVSQARLYVATVPEDPTDEPEPANDTVATAALDSFGGGPGGRAQIINRLAINLFVAGDGWLVGIPRRLLPGHEDDTETTGRPLHITSPTDRAQTEPSPGIDLDDIEWRMLSVSEVTTQADNVKLTIGQDEVTASPDELYLIRVWRPHPRQWWDADSPTRSSLPVLRELIGLTMQISAQVDSRLAGAGLLVVAESIARALKSAAGIAEDEDVDPFTDALIEAMITPISDRSAASAVVPLTVTVPDDAVDKIKHLTFSTPLDAEARNLREEAIRRLSLGLDAPPELLLGTAESNHWNSWLVQAETVTTHIEPPLALICDALTTQFLRPVLLDQGYSQDQVDSLAVWYDVDHMIARPNRGSDALNLYDRNELTGEALRGAVGFDNSDAPPADQLDPARSLALELVRADPSLMTNPGLESVVTQIEQVMTESVPGGDTPDMPEAPTAEGGDITGSPEAPVERVEPGPPGTADDDAATPTIAASGNGRSGVMVPAMHNPTDDEVDGRL